MAGAGFLTTGAADGAGAAGFGAGAAAAGGTGAGLWAGLGAGFWAGLAASGAGFAC